MIMNLLLDSINLISPATSQLVYIPHIKSPTTTIHITCNFNYTSAHDYPTKVSLGNTESKADVISVNSPWWYINGQT